jgi:hypothetical protein
MQRSGRASGEPGGFAGAFSRGLLDPVAPVPNRLAGPGGKDASRRYNVYRNNVTVSLIEALADIFPATRRIVGDPFFRDMARIFVRTEPPGSPLLFEYGRAFPGFIDRFEHAAALPWLGDVARIERAWLDAYHAADAPALDAASLGAIAEEALPSATFTPHPAMRVLRSAYPAVSIFAANRHDGPVGRIEASDGEDGLVTRPSLSVMVRRLPPGGAEFITGLAAGMSLAGAAEGAFAADGAFDLAANIAGMIEAGAFAAVSAAGR